MLNQSIPFLPYIHNNTSYIRDYLNIFSAIMLMPNVFPTKNDYKLTIGIPIYNGGNTITRAIDSLLHQTRKDFIIYISDNASTDTTEPICKNYSNKYENIIYHRQTSNIGAINNFYFLLKLSTTEYFMFAACDDLWENTFIEKCLGFLENNRDYTQCQSKVLFTIDKTPRFIASGTIALKNNKYINTLNFIRKPSDNSRFYGIFRTKELQLSYPHEEFFAHDYVVSALSLQYGKHAEIDEVLMIRDTTEFSSYRQLIANDHKSFIKLLFPAYEASIYLFKHKIIPFSWQHICAIIKLNIAIHLSYSPYRILKSVGVQSNLSKILRLLTTHPRHYKYHKDIISKSFTSNTMFSITGVSNYSLYDKKPIKWCNDLTTIEINKNIASKFSAIKFKIITPLINNNVAVILYMNSNKLMTLNIETSPIIFTLPLIDTTSENTRIEFLCSHQIDSPSNHLNYIGFQSIKLIK